MLYPEPVLRYDYSQNFHYHTFQIIADGHIIDPNIGGNYLNSAKLIPESLPERTRNSLLYRRTRAHALAIQTIIVVSPAKTSSKSFATYQSYETRSQI
jgi:hypothetical protein